MSADTTEETATKPAGVLARKLGASKEDVGSMKGSLTLKGLRRALARAAQDLCDLPLAVLAARQNSGPPEDLPELLSDKHLLVVLDGPDGRVGAVTMDAALVTALIQKQTIGQLMGKPPAERIYTPTDAAMSAEFLEAAFAKVVELLEELPDRRLFEGYRFGAQVEDVRNLVLGLEGETYRVISLNLDIAVGTTQGQIIFVLPEPAPEQSAETGAGASLGNSMGSMRAELSAVLCKMKLPLSEFSGLSVGDMLPLDQAYLYETDLVAVSGQVISQGRLGQLNGARAVRLNEPRTKLVSDLDSGEMGFAAGVGADELPMADEPPTIDLGIAAEDLQDPMGGLNDGAGLGGDLGGNLGAGLDMGAGDLPDIGGLGGDLGAGLPGDLTGADALSMDAGGLGGDLGGDLSGDMPGLGDAPMAEFNADDAAAEIEKLAGLGT